MGWSGRMAQCYSLSYLNRPERQRHPSGQHNWRGGSIVLSDHYTRPVLALSLHCLQVLSAVKAVSADACVG